jgi:hypothetical protein
VGLNRFGRSAACCGKVRRSRTKPRSTVCGLMIMVIRLLRYGQSSMKRHTRWKVAKRGRNDSQLECVRSAQVRDSCHILPCLSKFRGRRISFRLIFSNGIFLNRAMPSPYKLSIKDMSNPSSDCDNSYLNFLSGITVFSYEIVYLAHDPTLYLVLNRLET